MLLVGVLAGVNASDASAAALGSMASSAGLLATLLAVLAMKSWPSVVSTSAVSTAGCALLVAAVLAWWLPVRPVFRVLKDRRWMSAPCRATAEPVAHPVAPPVSSNAGNPALQAEMTALFLRVHEAWARNALETLGGCLTPELLAEMLQESTSGNASPGARVTEFRMVAAEVVDLESLSGVEIASVAFSGLVREGSERTFVPFRELWLLVGGESTGGGWRLARHQVLY